MFLMRRVGYGFERKIETGPASRRQATRVEAGEEAFSRRLGANQYPKFHAYAKKEDDNLIVNLHLDQKKPVYSGITAHSGEYDGAVVEQEAERIKILMAKIK